MAVIPLEKDANRCRSDRDPRPGRGADRRTRPRHRRFTASALDAGHGRAGGYIHSLLHCSGSIRCSIRSGMIRASRYSSLHPRRRESSDRSSPTRDGYETLVSIRSQLGRTATTIKSQRHPMPNDQTHQGRGWRSWRWSWRWSWRRFWSRSWRRRFGNCILCHTRDVTYPLP